MTEPSRVATVGQLRALLEGVPDDTPLTVYTADFDYPEVVDEQVITSTGFGLVDWGDGYGLEPDRVFALNCHVPVPGDDVRRKPVRPARGASRSAGAEADHPAAEPAAEL
jgi:hypothetical protein